MDIKTRSWAKDILYFWTPPNTRIYIIPSSRDCDPILSSFSYRKRRFIQPEELSSIRLQGTQIFFPALYQEKGISTKELYNFLKLPKPNNKVTFTDEKKKFECLDLFPEDFKVCEDGNENKDLKYSENQ